MHTNRLAQEQSPYLQQHQHNPVDWYPWGEEAFARARREVKPIFLSIGYSTCHWCHVMERESFEDTATAEFLNRHFVSIKVDREERPDVDKIYMTFVQATAGQGGWPLNVFLTPDLKPFYGGTYFPPDQRQGRPAFRQILTQISQLWNERREELTRSAEDLHAKLQNHARGTGNPDPSFSSTALHQAAGQFKSEYDPRHGGFGGAPKFPRPSQPLFLLQYAARFDDPSARRMVLHTCARMAAGGIYDQLGGGFARYAVDAEWQVPHFEKMLYDNAQLVNLYLDAYLVSGEQRFADIARETLAYVRRDMTHPKGGFYSAEDADSEGHEGKFYCWTQAELETLLEPPERAVALRYFGITTRGNFVDHSHPQPLAGQNVLSVANPNLTPEELPLLASAKAKMFQARQHRIRPHRDDKILASWNGLMLGAFARAWAVLADPTYRAIAEQNLAFLRATLWDATHQTLYHRWRDGKRDTVQLLNAYSFVLSGVLDLYEATLDAAHLEWAVSLAEAMITRFHDKEQGAFWQSPPQSADLILNCKEDYDGAEPSGNSVATLSLLRLATLTGRADFRKIADRTLAWSGDRLRQLPQAVPHMLLALTFALEEPHRAVIVGDPDAAPTRQLITAVHGVYQPHKVVLGPTGLVEPFAKTLPRQPSPRLYLCTGTACLAPIAEAAKVRQHLTSGTRGAAIETDRSTPRTEPAR